jgi:hypothetical protein
MNSKRPQPTIAYMQRTRAYYGAQGYPPYAWAHNEKVPFAPMAKTLRESTLALITTAAPFDPDKGDQGPGAAYNAGAKFFDVYTKPVDPVPDLRISHIGYDRRHCEARDPRTWLPIERLQTVTREGVIGQLADELIGVPTNRSQRTTLEQDAPAALEQARRLQADVVLLVPT